MSEKNPYRIEILSVACDVLEHLLSARGRPQRLSDIARELGINSSRAFRILKTLLERGYVEKDPQTQGYLLGIRFLEFEWALRGQHAVRRVASPILEELARATGDTTYLLVRKGSAAVPLDR